MQLSDIDIATLICYGLSYPPGWFDREDLVSEKLRSTTEWYALEKGILRCHICKAEERRNGNRHLWVDKHRAWHMSRLDPDKVAAALAIMAMQLKPGMFSSFSAEIAGAAVHQAFTVQDIIMARTWVPATTREMATMASMTTAEQVRYTMERNRG